MGAETKTTLSTSAKESWERLLANLRDKVGAVVFESWFTTLRMEKAPGGQNEVLVVSVANDFLARQLRHPLYFPTFRQLVEQEFGSDTAIEICSRSLRRLGEEVSPVASTKKLRLSKTEEGENLLSSPVVSKHEKVMSSLMEVHKQVSFDTILQLVSKMEEVPVSAICSGRRIQSVSVPRQMVMYLARVFTSCSTFYIGNRLGKRDHTTVVNGSERIRQLRQKDPVFNRVMSQYVDAIKKYIEPAGEFRE